MPFPSPGDLPDPGIEPRSRALQADALLSEPLEKSQKWELAGRSVGNSLRHTLFLFPTILTRSSLSIFQSHNLKRKKRMLFQSILAWNRPSIYKESFLWQYQSPQFPLPIIKGKSPLRVTL